MIQTRSNPPEELVKASYQALDLIKKFEGKKLTSYQCPSGEWSIGYGQTGPAIGPGLRITDMEADAMLANHVANLQEQISRMVKAPLSQQQFDALASFVYNVGAGAFQHSTLLKKLNAKQYHEASLELLRWNHIKGTESDGLSARRSAEYRLFNS